MIDGHIIGYNLGRSHGGESNQPVVLYFPDSTYKAELKYTFYKANRPWHTISMSYSDGRYFAELPNQPPAGKLEYYIILYKNSEKYTIPVERTVVTRFKGAVPMPVLIPHVLFMFIAMLLANVSALEAIVNGSRLKIYTILTTVTLLLGGMILGPVVQKFAFGEFWTGVPFGFDLTDNKTLVAMLGWILALVQVLRKKSKYARWWVVAAAFILLLVFSIPHSMMGSQLDYNTMQIKTG
jgi:hypothetical protein